MVFAFRGTHTPEAWEDWREWGGDNYDVTDDGVVVSSGLTPTYVDPEPVTTPSGRPADVALDECGTLYVLTRDGAVYRDDRDDGVLEPVPWRLFEDGEGGDGGGDGDAGDGDAGAAPPAPAGLALTHEAMYVLDGTGRLHEVSRDFWTTRRVLDTFEGPVAVVADETRAYVLEARAEGSAVVAVDADGGAEPVVSTMDLTVPLDLSLDADGNLYVLATDATGDDPGPVVQRFDRDADVEHGFAAATEPVRVPDHFDPACIAVVGTDEIVVGMGEADDGPDAVGRRTLVRYLPERGTFERVSTFEGASETLLLRRVAQGGERGLYVLDPHGVLTFLAEARTNRLSRATGGYDARVVRRFDSGLTDVEWHRVTLEFTPAGPGTGVRLSYAATDDDVGLEDVDWVPLGRSDPQDALLSDARGRYLWVELTVVGTESTSPALHSFRAYFPRSSYLRYLPAIYGEDEESAAFLERLLSIFESVYLGIEEGIDSLPRFLDARGIDAGFLGWLESWLALAPEEAWQEGDRRALLEAAPALYRGRGTRAGLIALVRLFLAAVEPPTVSWEAARERERATVEGLVADGYLSEAEGEDLLAAHEALAEGPTSDLLYLVESRDLDCIDDPGALAPYRRLVPCPHCFVVLLAPYVDRERRRTVERIVDTERPAHAVGRTVGLQPWVELGGHAYLGVNSTLPTRELVLERSGLGRDSVLAGPDPAPLSAAPCEAEGTSGGANRGTSGTTDGEASADD
jgi:phage tail-like protein